jgi:hypothetical protein
MMKFLLILSTFLFSSLSAFADRPGYLEDFQYHVANFQTFADAQNLMNTELPYFAPMSVCADRAMIWAFLMRQKGFKVGKVYIFFTHAGRNAENKGWDYHVAPYVLVNGEEYVLDTVFPEFGHRPAKMGTWTQYFGSSDHCVVLDPVHNPAHLKLEQNDLPSDNVTPLTFKRGGVREYPSDEGVCYIRKTPMYYGSPISVYAADLALAGDAQYANFVRTDFNPREVKRSCNDSFPDFRRFPVTCEEYLGL